MAWLVGMSGALAGRRFPLDASCLVGRGPYNHVVLDDTRISRQHAKISPEAGGHVVYDLNSANGTFVNDVQIKRHRLAANDLVRFGPFSFKFESEDEGVRQPVRRAGGRHEELTRPGFEPPAKIVNSLDASSAVIPPITTGLVELEDAERKLRTLYAFMQSIATTLDTAELIDRIVRYLLEVFPGAALVSVYLREPATGKMEPRKVVRRDGGPASAFTLAPQLHEEVVRKARAILSAPMSLSWEDESEHSTRGVSMHAPMMYRDVTHGVLHVRAVDRNGELFSQNDLDLLTAIAAQAAMALQSARMHQESLKQQRLQQDLVLAEQIQKSFLPRTLPSVPGIEFVTEYRPAFSVGGDFYDVFWLSKDKLAVFIGDVSGKGVSAALLMARVSSDLRTAALVEPEPAKAILRVNRAVVDRRQHDIFVTAICMTFDVSTRRVVLANAGHPPPMVRRADGRLERVEGGASTAIGIFEDATYEQVEFNLEPGDAMVLCTDGVLEATDARGEQFGFEGLEGCLRKGGAKRVRDLAERLNGDLKSHVGEASQYDDLTVIFCAVTEDLEERDEILDAPTDLSPVYPAIPPLLLTERPPVR